MDSQNFDRKTAKDWADLVESKQGSIRDADIYPMLRCWIDATSPVEILDVGCGQGVCSDHIDLTGRNYTGVEPSPFLLDRARTLYVQANRRFIAGNAYELPLSNDAIDAAFSVSVWHLLDDLSAAAAELSRVLRPDGHFLIITANPNAYPAWVQAYSKIDLAGNRLTGTVLHPDKSTSIDVLFLHDLDVLIKSLEDHDLRVDDIIQFRRSEPAAPQGKFISLQGRKRRY